MKKTIATDQTSSNIAQVLDVFTATPGKLESLSRGFATKQLDQPLGPGQRSFHQVLAHMLHCEARSSEAIYLALLADEPLLTKIHSERDFGKLVAYDQMPLAELLEYFKFRRTVLLRVLRALNDKQWSRSVREPGKQRKESVYLQARRIATHEMEHLLEMGISNQ